MRNLVFVAFMTFIAARELHAADLTPPLSPEKQALADFNKGVNNPDKDTRLKAIETYAATKPPAISWSLFVRVATSDPEAEVRHAAFTALAKMPAHDSHMAKMLVSIYNSLKPNDLKERLVVAKLMAPSEFKWDVVATLVDQLEKLRWPVDPMGYYGKKVSDKVKDEVKEKQDEIKEFVTILNDIGKGDIPEATKEANIKVKKWWDMNQAKFVKADAELATKYAKEDADAAKAAKEAAATKKPE